MPPSTALHVVPSHLKSPALCGKLATPAYRTPPSENNAVTPLASPDPTATHAVPVHRAMCRSAVAPSPECVKLPPAYKLPSCITRACTELSKPVPKVNHPSPCTCTFSAHAAMFLAAKP